jgi:hypothetical protein
VSLDLVPIEPTDSGYLQLHTGSEKRGKSVSNTKYKHSENHNTRPNLIIHTVTLIQGLISFLAIYQLQYNNLFSLLLRLVGMWRMGQSSQETEDILKSFVT